ncbi:hypothetical protein [Streptosporangium sandarakinum]|uniref:hypothetical protein n=1 Tax=Streptosporangium sandarakinum TaxID=1260955 RepID=UPI003721B6C4
MTARPDRNHDAESPEGGATMGDLVRFPRPIRDASDAPALPLPAAGAESAPAPLDGVVLPRPAAREGAEAVPLPVRLAGRVVAVRDAERTAAIVRAVLRTSLTIGQGWHSWLIRSWDALTLGVYRKQIRAAEAAGDREALAEWVERKQRAAVQRHARMMDLPHLVLGLLKVTGGGLLALLVLLLVLSIAVWATGVGEFGAVFGAIGALIRGIFQVIAFIWTPLLICSPAALLLAAWREGRRRGTAPAWLLADDADAEGREVIPDEGAILNALRNLGISKLDKAFKEGWRPRFVLPTERDGKGYHTQLELPPAVTVEMINDRKKVLAHNLVRFPVEVWPTEPRNLPGVLDMWVADQGALSGPVDPWPLLHTGSADYFKGVPCAVNIRGKSIVGRLFEANYAAAGMMGSGKSTLLITLLLGSLLDPLVEADVFVMAENADYEPMKPRLRTLRTGQGSDVVEACMTALRDAYNDLTVRGRALKEHDSRAVTRELAAKDARLRPRVFVIDECQALFMHEEFGEEAAEIAVKLITTARKYAVSLMFATPEPSSDSLPRKVMAVTSNKACFAIGDQRSNDAILGTGSYREGISAVGLEPKTDEGPGDVGTFMARGFTPKPGLLRGYYVSQSDARAVVERAMKLREQAGIGPAGTIAAEEKRDLLADLLGVISGAESVPAAQALAALKAAHPTHRPYAALRDRMDLVHTLGRLGVAVPATKNRYPIDPVTLRARMAERAAAGIEDDDRVG